MGICRVFINITCFPSFSCRHSRSPEPDFTYTDVIMFDSTLDICQTPCQARYGQLYALASLKKQQTWDQPIVEAELAELTERQANNFDKAILLASTSKHSGDWLYATPISSCGLCLDNEAVQIAVGFRLCIDICEPQSCVCGELVDFRRSYALSSKRNSGRIIHHNYLNDIIHRSLNRAAFLLPKSRKVYQDLIAKDLMV